MFRFPDKLNLNNERCAEYLQIGIRMLYNRVISIIQWLRLYDAMSVIDTL